METTLEKPKALTDQEAGYLMGEADPVKSSLLISSSTYLNNPLFRDLYAQMGLKRDGHDLPGAYLIPDINRAFAEVTDGQRLFNLLQQERDSLPEFATWLDTRFTSDFKVEELKGFEPDTLGAMIHAFIGKSGMQIDFMFRSEPANDFDYLNKRRVQNHDIEHMVTGLDPSPVGEVGLIVANTMAINNYFGGEFAADLNRHGLFLVSTGLMRMSCHYGSVVSAYLEAISLGRALGEKQRKPLFMIKWEEYLGWTIPAIREEFSFQDGPPSGYWQWTHDAAKG